MDKCCSNFVMSAEPNDATKTGTFNETHKCPTCGKAISIRFQAEPLLGGEVSVGAVDAEYARSR